MTQRNDDARREMALRPLYYLNAASGMYLGYVRGVEAARTIAQHFADEYGEEVHIEDPFHSFLSEREVVSPTPLPEPADLEPATPDDRAIGLGNVTPLRLVGFAAVQSSAGRQVYAALSDGRVFAADPDNVRSRWALATPALEELAS
jgi:hypothetical protein